MINVLIVSNCVIMRAATQSLLQNEEDICIVGESSNCNETLQMAKSNQPDIVIIDIQMSGIEGIETVSQLIKYRPDTKIIILTPIKYNEFLQSFIKAGVSAYLSKNIGKDQILECVHKVYSGEYYYESAQDHLLKQNSKNFIFAKLTDRELQVMHMITSGEKIKVIADKLNLSIKTVSTYRHRLLKKLSKKNDVELTHLVLQFGLPIINDENF